MQHLFSYGTLQKTDVQLKLFGRLLHGSKDILKGYKLSFIEITDEAFLAKGDGKDQRIAIRSDEYEMIEGIVFEVTADELAQADKYEPIDYKGIEVDLISGKKAWIYAAAM